MATSAPTSLVILYKPFALRMKQACDEHQDIPDLNNGRLVSLKQRMEHENQSVSLQTIMRWYHGASLPRPQNLLALAKVLNVSPSWLSHGPEDESKVDTSARRIITEGAINALCGHMQISGLPCAFPEPDDPMTQLVHFYSIIGGRQHPIHVASSTHDEKGSSVVFQIPTGHPRIVVALVLPMEPKSIEVWHITREIIEQQRANKSDMITISAKLDKRTLSIGRSKLEPIEDFNKVLLP